MSDADVARKCSRFGTVLEVAVNPSQKAALVHFDCKDSAVGAADDLRGKVFHGSRLKVCSLVHVYVFRCLCTSLSFDVAFHMSDV